MRLNPYLNFNGQCREAFEFYARVLGGRIVMMQTHGESPICNEVSPGWHDRIVHARLDLGDQMLMGSDSPPGWEQKTQGIHVALHIDEVAEGRRVFDALTEGGAVQMPFEETFWAAGFGMFVDRFGVPWMVNCERPVAEQARAARRA